MNLQTKSPHTDRVVKWGRWETGPPPSKTSAVTQAAHPSNAPIGHSEPPVPQARPAGLSMPLPAAFQGIIAEHLTHLESLLDSILATIMIIQSVNTAPTLSISSHAQDALKLIHTLIPLAHTPNDTNTPAPQQHKPAHKATASKLYAQAAHTTCPLPAGQLTCTRTSPRNPHPTQHSPYHLIVHWAGHPIPSTSFALDQFVRDLDTAVSDGGFRRLGTSRREHLSRIAGANVTKTGNLVIHTRAPFTATQLREYSEEIKYLAGEIPGFDPPVTCTPELELDVPWYGIVIHGLPAVSLLAAYEGDRGDNGEALGLWEALEKETGIPQADIRDVRVLCCDEEQGKRKHLSSSNVGEPFDLRPPLSEWRLSPEHSVCHDTALAGNPQ